MFLRVIQKEQCLTIKCLKRVEKFVVDDVDQEPLINLQHITYDPVGTSGYKSKEDLIKRVFR